VAFSGGFVEENPQGINPIILWIGLIIMELGFDDFWGFTIDWLGDFVLINDGVFLDVDFTVLCSCSGWLCVGSGYGY
jgi:hypothetical protein